MDAQGKSNSHGDSNVIFSIFLGHRLFLYHYCTMIHQDIKVHIVWVDQDYNVGHLVKMYDEMFY